MRSARLLLALAVAVLATVVGTANAASPPTVFAAASLTEAFPKIDPQARYSFAGSNTLALQIRQGAPADVFASAAPNFTQDLYRDGLVEKPRFLAFNRLAVIVPRSNPAGIRSVYDLRRDGVKLVVASARVPVGAYTRTVFRRLRHLERPGQRGERGERREGRRRQGRARRGGRRCRLHHRRAGRRLPLRQVAIPVFAQPTVRYEIAVVRSSSDKAAARAFVAKATGPAGRRALAAAGFRFPAPAPKPRRPRPGRLGLDLVEGPDPVGDPHQPAARRSRTAPPRGWPRAAASRRPGSRGLSWLIRTSSAGVPSSALGRSVAHTAPSPTAVHVRVTVRPVLTAPFDQAGGRRHLVDLPDVVGRRLRQPQEVGPVGQRQRSGHAPGRRAHRQRRDDGEVGGRALLDARLVGRDDPQRAVGGRERLGDRPGLDHDLGRARVDARQLLPRAHPATQT